MDKIVMTDLEYLDCAEALLKAVETCCDHINDHSDADVDNQRTGAMVTLSFANRSQIIINLQKPLQEVWMAAQAGGEHDDLEIARAVVYMANAGGAKFADPVAPSAAK